RSPLMRTALRTIVALGTLAALCLPVAGSVLAAGITVSPNAGAPATTAGVSGNGFAGNTTVRVFFNGSGGTLVWTESTDGSGNLPIMAITIPSATGGMYQIFATDGSNTATTSFTVPFSLSLSQPGGGAGSAVNILGSGFLPSETVVVGWDQAGNQVAAAPAN